MKIGVGAAHFSAIERAELAVRRGIRCSLLGPAGRLALLAGIAAAGNCGVVCADSSAAPEGQVVLEEITVTAQKREERLQETPISISAFNRAAIEKLGVNNLRELSEHAPNVRFDFTAPISGASNAAGIFIRGIGQSDFALTTEAGVGTYVDGVYMSRSIGGVLDVLDVERMEILRGPQGTLFGRNTIGGAINIVTAIPEATFGGTASLAVGSDNRLYMRGSVNLPISDTLRVRIAASSKQLDGYVKGILGIDNTASSPVPQGQRLPGSGSPVDYGNENRQAARLVAAYDPGSVFRATLSADYSRIHENNAPAVLRGITGTLANGPIVFVYNTFQAPTSTIPGFPNANYTPQNFITGNLDSTYATGPNGTNINAWGTALILDWGLSEELKVRSTTSLRRETGYFNRDADGSPIDITHTSNYGYEHEQLSQEVQLTGAPWAGRVKYAAGAYFFHETGSDPLVVEFPSSFGMLYQRKADVSNRSLAAYAQATVALTNRLSVTAGVRHTRDEKEFVSDQYLITGSVSPIIFGVPAGTLIPLVPRNSGVKKTFANTSPRASVDYRFSNDLMVYASYSEGFKSGGFNLRYVSPRPAILPFDPEKVHTAEAGLKSELFARRLRVNVAAFSTNYDDVQLTVFENLGAPVTLNGGDAKIKGAELELTALPVENLELSLSGGYLDAYYTSVRQSPAIIVTPEQRITTSTKLQKTPKWTATLGFDYDVPVRAGGKVRLHADWKYTADVYNDAQNSVFLFQPASKIGDAALEYMSASKRWSLRLFVDNVTDKRVIVSGDSNYGIGFHEAEYNRPREWGIAGRLNF